MKPTQTFLLSFNQRLSLGILSLVLLLLGSPNRWLHLFPAALVGLAPLFLLVWDLRFWQRVQWVSPIWFIFCLYVFLPDLSSTNSVEPWQIIGGAIVAPLVPLFFITATTLSLQLTQRLPPWIRPLGIATLWTSLDGILGFAWFPLPFHWGSLLYDWPRGIQIADITGIWGITFITILTNATLASVGVYLLLALRHQGFRAARPYFLIRSIALLGGLWLSVLSYGSLQLNHYRSTVVAMDTSDSVIPIATLQPMAWYDTRPPYDLAYRTERYQELIELSQQGIQQGATLIIWPEGAVRGRLYNSLLEPYIFTQLEAFSGSLITGSSEPDPAYATLADELLKFNNSALLYNADGTLLDRYGKQWLFPFFETSRYVSSQDGYRPLQGNDGTPLGVMICLESVLPQPSRLLVQQGANSLIAISDDSWFGNSNWPLFHANLSIFRAIENRRSFVFVNNTGGNLIVDPSGIVQVRGKIF